ncbi:TetR/AcrR family transcriptional regulator [Paenibacillus crassostreae]|uniref:TetR family transcriptional regulator n=1 Tax=Paenibacillus crassostreae TaxID=1763538 RepID=A0A167AVU5_9BACL|nr:TetR/AcrR family transcriptional regulator [Paenibacillus crassostreae]AOZ93665.1 TetR family transcriptional regulator [Paenibacillus crassostreae]OAB71491.1 TetR family transcriptional regulator [Paenibacillus crassostreae]
MGEIRNAERTRKKILEAARGEFFSKGYTGTRIESIATRANVKKQLLYHYFKGKEEIFEAVMENLYSQHLPISLKTPTNPVLLAEHRLEVNIEYRMDFLKFTAWQALEDQPDNPHRNTIRKQVLQSYVEDLSSKQEFGLVPEDLDPALLTLAITSLTTYPLVFADATKMITGMSPTDKEFQEKWKTFLTKISEKILTKDSSS